MLSLHSETARFVMIIIISAWTVHTERIYFARYLNTELFPLRPHKVVGESVSSCIDKCKASNNCNYINYHVLSHLCDLIDGCIEHGVIIEDILEQARGYVFGNKANWTTNSKSGYLFCHGDGKCTVNSKEANDTCPVSGCKPPETKPDAFVNGNMQDVGNKVKYECSGQLKMAGARQHISTCLESGNWSSTDFQCLPDCGPAPSVENGIVVLDIPGISTEDATASVICNSSYVPANIKISCQPSGIWETPLCLQAFEFTCRHGITWEYASSATCGCVLDCPEAENRYCLCKEYQERFRVLPNLYIENNNVASTDERVSEQDCVAFCRGTPGCKSVDIFESGCFMNHKMPHELTPKTSQDASLILRKCDPCN